MTVIFILVRHRLLRDCDASPVFTEAHWRGALIVYVDTLIDRARIHSILQWNHLEKWVEIRHLVVHLLDVLLDDILSMDVLRDLGGEHNCWLIKRILWSLNFMDSIVTVRLWLPWRILRVRLFIV